MNIVNTIVKAIEFKSIPEMYIKERDGIKSNTIRSMVDIEIDMYEQSLPEYIKIINTKNSTDFFVRKLNDVTDFYKHNDIHIVLFSWG